MAEKNVSPGDEAGKSEDAGTGLNEKNRKEIEEARKKGYSEIELALFALNLQFGSMFQKLQEDFERRELMWYSALDEILEKNGWNLP